MIINENKALKMMCPELGSECVGRECMAWSWDTAGDNPEYCKRENINPGLNGYCVMYQRRR